MRTCPTCGREGLSEAALLCPGCGRALSDSAVARVATQSAFPREDGGAGQPATYPCGHVTEAGFDRCRFCDTDAQVELLSIEAPWGVVVLGEDLCLGRDPAFSPHAAALAECDNVSRQHAVLRVSAEGVVVEDRYSENGTFIDGIRLGRGESRVASPGSEIRLASNPPVVFRVVES